MLLRTKSFLFFLVVVWSIADVKASVDIGLFISGDDTLEVRVRPDANINAIISNIQFTVRWTTSDSVSLGILTSAPGIISVLQKSGPETDDSGFRYQAFFGLGFAPAVLASGVEVVIMTIPVTGGCSDFAIINDTWTGNAVNNGDYYLSLGGQNSTGVIYTDTVNTCDTLAISGTILTETGIPVPGVTVNLSGDDSLSAITLSDGFYRFNVAKGGNYTVTPSKNNDINASNGITTLDIVLTQAHILAIRELTSPYKIIAADGNGSLTVTTLDLVLGRAIILANTSSYPVGRLWEFVNSDFVFPDPGSPFPFEKTRSYSNNSSSRTDQNFIGVKLGDVNASWNSSIP